MMEEIKSASTSIETLSLDLDLGGVSGFVESVGFVLVGLTDRAGNLGIGWTYSISRGELLRIQRETSYLSSLVVGSKPSDRSRTWALLRDAARSSLPRIDAPAVSAVDIALWDLYGRQQGKAVHRLLGAENEHLETYASGDMWQSVPTAALVENAKRFVSSGFRNLKIRTQGSKAPEVEAHRFRSVREAVGPEVKIMYDALQLYTPDEAISIALALEPFDVAWFEDPVLETNIEGCSRVAAELDIPVVVGEDTFWPEGYTKLVESKAMDILMVDVKCVGGVTPWLALATEMDELGVSIVSHISPEISAPVLAWTSSESPLEWFPWSFCLYEEPPVVRDGRYVLPRGPGFGLTYRSQIVERLTR